MSRVTIDPESPLARQAGYFARALAGERKRPGTIDVYLHALKSYDDFAKAQEMPRQVTKIKREHVEAYMADQQSRLAASTAAIRYAGLLRFFRWAVESGEMKKSPLTGMHSPQVPDSPVVTLTEEQIRAILKACEGTSFRQRRDYAIVRLLADTGCRRSEVAGMRLADIDQDGYRATVTGKGQKTRTVIYSPQTAVAIDRYLMLRDEHPKQRLGELWLGRAGALSPDAVNEIVQRRSRRAGIANAEGRPIHAHQFRHTFAHRSKAAGMSEEQIMVLGGWSDSATMRKYGRSEATVRAIDAGSRVLALVAY